MENKNIYFNTDEEALLKNHLENNEINQFNNIIVSKICKEYGDESQESWEYLMDILEKSQESEASKAIIALLPEEDREILTANIFYVTLDELLR